MSRTEIFNKLKDCFKEMFPDFDTDKVSEESLLREDLGLTSVTLIYLVLAIENEFEISLDDVSFSSFKTIGNVIDYIEKL